MLNHEPAALLLEDGTLFRGRAFGARGATAGEVVFNTAITGYQEVLTDPSYRAQIVTMTWPHIGNTGINAVDLESGRVQVAGFIVRDLCPEPSNWRSEQTLDGWLREAGVIGLCDIDTRALVRRLRVSGAMRGSVLTGEAGQAALQARLAAEPPMEGRDLVSEVTCTEPFLWREGTQPMEGGPAPLLAPGARRFRVVAYDFGVKRNILRLLVDHGCEVVVVPATTPAAEALGYEPDGIFLSNGPGDPAAVGYAIEATRELLASQVPLFGICLGHQILALALGGTTYKLRFGHRGANQPVHDLQTGRIEITSQNHGFAVRPEGLPDGALVSPINLNDGTVAGQSHRDIPAFSVQNHPEANPGPHDAGYLFRRFTDLMETHRCAAD
ncbi:MAG: glutamine-hydrolyzing carbamoyl-phosphate synthase small subunit [bacterium]